MFKMPIVDLLARGREIAARGERVSVLWQEPESLAFVARGREYRSEFHVNPSDEVMLMIKGEMRLHYRTPDGKEAVAVVPEGSTIYTPAGTPHSPRFPPDAFLLVIERRRRPGEVDASCGSARVATRRCTRRPRKCTTTEATPSRRPMRAFSTARRSAPARLADT